MKQLLFAALIIAAYELGGSTGKDLAGKYPIQSNAIDTLDLSVETEMGSIVVVGNSYVRSITKQGKETYYNMALIRNVTDSVEYFWMVQGDKLLVNCELK